jgi:hypothetical protein
LLWRQFIFVMEAIDRCGYAPEDKLRLVPHTIANFTTLAGTRGASNRVAEGILDALIGVGIFITNIGRLPEGYLIKEFVLEKRRRILGEEYPDTISAMGNLASTLGDQG